MRNGLVVVSAMQIYPWLQTCSGQPRQPGRLHDIGHQYKHHILLLMIQDSVVEDGICLLAHLHFYSTMPASGPGHARREQTGAPPPSQKSPAAMNHKIFQTGTLAALPTRLLRGSRPLHSRLSILGGRASSGVAAALVLDLLLLLFLLFWWVRLEGNLLPLLGSLERRLDGSQEGVEGLGDGGLEELGGKLGNVSWSRAELRRGGGLTMSFS